MMVNKLKESFNIIIRITASNFISLLTLNFNFFIMNITYRSILRICIYIII